MRIVLTITFCILLVSVLGQTCIHDDLSRTLRIITKVRRPKGDTILSPCYVEVSIIDKASKKNTQVISFLASELSPSAFLRSSRARSYSTGKNRNAPMTITDYGDIVVADLNFDSREDIAVRCEDGMPGTYYRFYLQGKDKIFRLDSFLTDSMMYFPEYINRSKKRLTTYEDAGVRNAEDSYQLDMITNKWRMIRHRVIPPL